MAKSKVSKQIQQLFLRLLNFTPKTQEEAKLQNTSFDAEREYARLVLSAHFAEDRNECLSEGAILAVGRGEKPPTIGNSKPH